MSKNAQSKSSKAIELAISVFEDVLEDISGWEDKALSEAVQSAKSGLLSILMTEFDMPQDIQDGAPLWLWKNGDHFLAFKHLYPCFTPGGDPMVLGEPAGTAIFKTSFERSTFPTPASTPIGGASEESDQHAACKRAYRWLEAHEWKRDGDYFVKIGHCETMGVDAVALIVGAAIAQVKPAPASGASTEVQAPIPQAATPTPAPEARKPLTDAQIDDLDSFALSVMAPEGRFSVRDFARAIERAHGIASPSGTTK